MSASVIKQSIKQASIIIAFFTFSSQLLGLVREALLASFFGTSAEYDILLVALAVPMMFSTILFMAVPSAGMPYLQQAEVKAAGHGSGKTRFIKTNTIIILVVSAAVFFLLPMLNKLLSGSLSESQLLNATRYGRLFCLLIPMRAYEAVYRSLLHLRQNFIFPAATNLGFNIVIIALLLALYPEFGSWAFVTAWLAGTAAQVLLVTVPAYLIYHDQKNRQSPGHFESSAYVKFLGSIVLIEGLGLIIPPFDRYLASIFLEPGYVSAINYADLVNSVPVRVFIYSVGTAIFPTLSERAARGDLPGLARLYHKAIALCIMIIIPIAMFSFVYRQEIIRLLFERGRFVAQSREITVEILEYYFVGMLFLAAFYVQAKVLYALKKWRPLITAKAVSFGAKAVIGFLFIKVNWALAIGGGTIVMLSGSFIILEIYLVLGLKLHYASADLGLLARAAISAAVACLLLAIANFVLADHLRAFPAMVIAGVVCFGGLFIMDQKFKITGINLLRRFKKAR